jgi:photosystem II stability/assembly factor-like uncharacterized protein
MTWFVSASVFVSPSVGYVAASWERPNGARTSDGGGLYMYRDGHWVLAPVRTDGAIEDVAFPDERHGWIASYDCARALVSVYRTQDSGANWSHLPIKTTHSCGGGPTYLSFPTGRTGWLEPVSPNGPWGEFLITSNGGTTWPGGGGLGQGYGTGCLNRITATSAKLAWMPCGPLLHTTNGGRTWHRQAFPLPPRWRTDTVTSAGDPRFFGSHGIVPLAVWSHRGKAVLFYRTTNGGRSWSLVGSHSAGGFCDRTFEWPSVPRAIVSIASPNTWWLVGDRAGRIDVTNDGGRHWSSHASLAGWCAVSRLTAGSAALAWITPRATRGAPLYETRNGGRTWRAVSFPLR